MQGRTVAAGRHRATAKNGSLMKVLFQSLVRQPVRAAGLARDFADRPGG
jgi:hypothetical protein